MPLSKLTAVYVPIPVRWLVALAFIALIVVLSITPGRGRTEDTVFVWLVVNTPTMLQKLMHLAAYALIVFLLAWALEGIVPRMFRLALAATLAISIGAGLEWYQTRVPGRFGTLFDIVLDAGGALLGVLAALLVM